MARRLALALLCGALLAALLLLPLAGALRAAPAPAGLRSVTLGMGYVPNVQFAPFYVADQRGYYRQAGINVHFSYGSSPNLLELVGAGKEEFAIADGTDALTARANGIPVSYVATLFRRLPVAIFSLAKRNIRTVRDLRGKTVGVPGRFGSTYVGLLAALHVAGLRLIDVNLRTVGYTQAETVVQGAVDAAVGYSNNEPLLLRRHGFNVTTIEVGAT
ncbi:MAG: ABC transporter substrate-binding protein, partial [Chloroflexi bacterium]|nr:ABC transporter substrate-binding protein [Chloroflexota bacterium]